MKTAIVFFGLGIGQGAILCDWFRSKQMLKIAAKKGNK
jgi:hypothetical protein